MTHVKNEVVNWIRQDFNTNPLRFLMEIVGMTSNLIASLILMIYSPNPPMFYAYIFFLLASVLLIASAISRRSTGLTVMYITYLGIDGVGFIKTLIW